MLNPARLIENNVTEKSINLLSFSLAVVCGFNRPNERTNDVSSIDKAAATAAAAATRRSSRCGWRERHAHTSTSPLKFVYRCANGRYTARGNETRELSRIDAIIIRGSIATRDEKPRSIICARERVSGYREVPLSYLFGECMREKEEKEIMCLRMFVKRSTGC